MSAGNTFDVCIVGGGVMGSATAYFLKKRHPHLKIALLEQFDFLHRKGSSHGDSRIIRMTYPQDHYTKLMSTAYKWWGEVERDSGKKVFTQTGGLDFGKRNNPELTQLITAARAHNIEMDILSPSQVKRRWGNVTLPKEDDWIAVYSPTSGILNATKAVAVFQGLAEKLGCVMKDNCPIARITYESLWRLETAQGMVYEAKQVVLSMGPWTKKVLRTQFGIELPLKVEQTTIGYFSIDPKVRDAYDSSQFPVFINYEDPLIYGLPSHEFPGLLKCAAHFGDEVDPSTRDFQPGQQALKDTVGPFLKNFYHGIKWNEVTRTESCLYTWTPDGDFIIDRVAAGGGTLILACGFSGHGFKLAPVVGEMLAQLTTDGHFSGPYSGMEEIFSIRRFKKIAKL